MLRRFSAVLTMLAIVGLIVLLMWQVQLHRHQRSIEDEPAVVESAPATTDFRTV